MNRFDEMRAAMEEARQITRAADSVAGQMAGMLEGRLRHVSPSTLAALKRELREFNAHTGKWRT